MLDIINKESRRIRQMVGRDIKAEMRKHGLCFVEGRLGDAIDYICMVNDIEFDGEYEYTGADWVCDTRFNYPELFGLNY